MSLILSGTDGLSDVDGSAATPAIRGTDANTGIFFPAADTVGVSTGGSERVRVDSSGNVGIGTTTLTSGVRLFASNATNGAPATTGTTQASGALRIRSGNNAICDFGVNGTTTWIQAADQTGLNTNYDIAMQPNGGNVGIGTSSPAYKLDVAATTAVVQMDSSSGTAGAAVTRYKASNRTWVSGVNVTDNTGAYTVYDVTASAERMRIDSSGRFLVNTTSVNNGSLSNFNFTGFSNGIETSWTGTTSIYHVLVRNGNGFLGGVNSNGSTAAFVNLSDYRVKENIQPMQGALQRVSLLKPCTFNFKIDGAASEGFIAHELQEVAPIAAFGEKDAVDEEGNPIHQGVDPSKIVALLTAAIQEQQALIQSLTARITALETP